MGTDDYDDLVKADRWNDIYDIVGNMPRSWVVKAVVLFNAGDLVLKHHDTMPFDEGNFDQAERKFDTLNIVRMLKGMGMECLLKATWLSTGENLAEGGKLKKTLKTPSHDLYAIARLVCEKASIPLSEEEGKTFARLAFGIETGRYPMAANIAKCPTVPTTKGIYLHSWGPKDEELCENFAAKLIAKVREMPAADTDVSKTE